MARRRSKMARNRRQGPGHNEANRQTRESRQKEKMLNGSREAHFRFDVEERLAADGMSTEDIRPFLQTLWTQGARNSTDAAREWLRVQVAEGRIDHDTYDRIDDLVRRYSTVR
jgi:hypothetical protein